MSTTLAFPKPKGVKRPIVLIRIHLDGREVIDTKRAKGMEEYKRRIEEMSARQGNICCLFGYSPVCHSRGSLFGYFITFEHENGRGGGKRDDRIILPSGRWINGAAHVLCNNWKGSRFIDYNRGFQNG